MTNNTDGALWRELKSGNHSALERTYNEHFSFLYNYGKKIAFTDEMVEDAIQELFVELWERRANLSYTDNIRPYLTISLKRKLVKAIKSNRVTSSAEFEENMFGSDDAIEKLLINSEHNDERVKRIKQALDSLSGRQREIIYLKYYHGMDYNDISEIMDLNYQSSRNLVSRALKKLASHIHILLITLVIDVLKYNF